MTNRGHVCFDLDGTLAEYDPETWDHMKVGKPVAAMVLLAKRYMQQGVEVRIFTARAHKNPRETDADYQRRLAPIREWCIKVFGQELLIVSYKTFETIAIFDDRAYRVVENTGEIVGGLD